MIDLTGKIDKLLIPNALPYLIETWQDPLGIPLTSWAYALTAGGTITDPPSLAEEPYQKIIMAGVAAGDAARLYTVKQWQLAPDTWGAATFNKLLMMEWEGKLAGIADIDNATFLMGLAAANNATRASNNIAGFILVADALNVITDDGGVETVTVVPAAPVLTNWHKFKIVAYNGIVEFWVDEVVEVRHTTIAAQNLPDVNAHGMFYILQEALGGGTGQLHVATTAIIPDVKV